MSLSRMVGLAGLFLGSVVAAGCGDSSSSTGVPAKPIANVNPTADNPNVSVDEEYKHMDKLKKGNPTGK